MTPRPDLFRPARRLLARLLMRVYRVDDATDDRPPLNMPGYLTPLLLVAAILVAMLLFRLVNAALYGMVEDRLEAGFIIEPSVQQGSGPAVLPPDLLGVFELIQRIAPDLDVSSEFAANVMPYLEKGELTADELAFLDNYRREKFDNDPLWIENNLVFQVLRPVPAEGDGAPRFAFGLAELREYLAGLPGLRDERPEAMDFLRVFDFDHVVGAPACDDGATLACRLRLLLAGYRDRPNLFGLYGQVRPPSLDGSLYALNRLSSAYRANEGRIDDTRTMIEALFAETAATADAPRRAMQALNGIIQWVTATAAIWCALILAVRRMWAKVQIRLIDGRMLGILHPAADASPGPWGGDRFSRAALRENLSRLGSQILPLRLVCAFARRRRNGEQEGLGHLDGIVEDYRAQVADQEYTVIGWLIMLVPTLGFIGTIYGMMLAMGGAHLIVAAENQNELKDSVLTLSQHLGTAFDTTLIALVFAALLEWLRGSTQRLEARAFDGLVREARAHPDRIEELMGEAPGTIAHAKTA